MKILCIISFYDNGGAQEAIRRVSRQLRQRGHDVSLWYLYGEGTPSSDIKQRIIVRGRDLSLTKYLFTFFRLWQEMRALRPDAVIGFLPLANVLGMVAARLIGVPVRVASQRSPGTTYGRMMRILDRIAGSLGAYTQVICVSGAVKDSFSSYPASYRQKLRVVHNGIEWRASGLDKQLARRKFGLPENGFVTFAAGRLHEQKNYPLLLDALAATPGVTLAIAGDGHLKDALAAQVRTLGLQDRVHFLGHVKREDICDLLRASDAFLQSSAFEGQSNAVLEAMHEGLPMLLSDIPEQRETVVDDEAGIEAALLAPLGQVKQWADDLSRLRDDALLREQLGARGKAMVEDRFSLTRMIDGFESAAFGRTS